MSVVLAGSDALSRVARGQIIERRGSELYPSNPCWMPIDYKGAGKWYFCYSTRLVTFKVKLRSVEAIQTA